MHTRIENLIYHVENIFDNPVILNDREIRTENRRNCCAALTTLIQYLDLDSNEVKIPSAKGNIKLNMQFFSKKSDLPIHKCYRAVKSLTDLNFIHKNCQDRFVVNVKKIM